MKQEYYSIDDNPEECARALVDLIKADIKQNPKVFRRTINMPELKNTKWSPAIEHSLNWTFRHNPKGGIGSVFFHITDYI